MPNPVTPFPDDPTRGEVESMIDVGQDWLLGDVGEVTAACAQAMRNDGSGLQDVVIFTMPVRRNHTTEIETLRVALSPEGATALADALAESGSWLLARRQVAN